MDRAPRSIDWKDWNVKSSWQSDMTWWGWSRIIRRYVAWNLLNRVRFTATEVISSYNHNETLLRSPELISSDLARRGEGIALCKGNHVYEVWFIRDLTPFSYCKISQKWLVVSSKVSLMNHTAFKRIDFDFGSQPSAKRTGPGRGRHGQKAMYT